MSHKVIVFSDLHSNEWAEFSHLDPKTGLNSRLASARSAILRIRKEAKKRKITDVVFCGDLFHVRGVVRVPVLQAVDEGLRRLVEVADVTILTGNHDQQDKEGNYTGTGVFKRERIQVVTEFSKDHDIGYMAYTANPNKFRDNLKTLYKAGVRNLFCHAGIHGAATGPRDYVPKEEIAPNEFKKFRRVFSGHYHQAQDIGKNITYVGAPMQHYRTERTYDPGFLVWDYDADEYERVSLDFPRFRRWETPDDDEDVAGNFVDAVLPKGWTNDRLYEHLEGLGVARANVLPRERGESHAPERRLEVDASTDVAVMLRKYAKKFHGKLDYKRLVKMGRRIVGA